MTLSYFVWQILCVLLALCPRRLRRRRGGIHPTSRFFFLPVPQCTCNRRRKYPVHAFQ